VHGLQLAEVLPGHPVPPGRQENGVVTGEHRERCISVVPQVKPLLLTTFNDLGMGMSK
jgi:hypothetical protein